MTINIRFGIIILVTNQSDASIPNEQILEASHRKEIMRNKENNNLIIFFSNQESLPSLRQPNCMIRKTIASLY